VTQNSMRILRQRKDANCPTGNAEYNIYSTLIQINKIACGGQRRERFTGTEPSRPDLKTRIHSAWPVNGRYTTSPLQR
jgi:hypothetical protein